MSSSCKLLELPPVGEMDHSIGTCYCHFCTCGLHKCPGEISKPKNYLPSSLTSLYKHDFTKKARINSEPILRNTPTHSGLNKMDLKTTNQHDFVKFELEKVSSARFEKESHLGALKFSGVSQYKSEFPNWGHYELNSVKNPKPLMSSIQVKLDGMTTYKQNFAGNVNPQPVFTRRQINVSNPLSSGSTNFPLSTSKSSYQPIGKNHFPERVGNKDLGIVPLVNVPFSYKSMYSSQFESREPAVVFKKKRDVIPKD